MRVDRRWQRRTGPRGAASLLAMAALGCVVAGGCAAVLGIEDDVEVIAPGDSGGDGGGSPGGSTSSGGSGGSVACSSPAQCPGADIECAVRTCTDGVCELEAKPAGTPAPQQTAGDCKRQECDGAGHVVDVVDVDDPEDDGQECTTDTCRGDETLHVAAIAGSPCGDGLACNRTGQCACDDGNPTACGASTACQTKECVDGVCKTTKEREGVGCDTCKQCAQGRCVAVVDGTDPADDCGECASCQLGACVKTPAGQPDPDLGCPGLASACNGNGQCQCDDATQNGGETGVDCGAVCSIPCPIGGGCSVGLDCATKCCTAQKTCGSCEAGCACAAPDAVCHAGGTCGD